MSDEVRTTSSTGGEKGTKAQRHDLMPKAALDAISEVFAFGATKYKDHNWRLGYEWSKSYAALVRHVTAFWDGETYDPESGLPHMAHAGCHVLFLLTWFAEQGEGGQFDDRYRPAPPMSVEEKIREFAEANDLDVFQRGDDGYMAWELEEKPPPPTPEEQERIDLHAALAKGRQRRRDAYSVRRIADDLESGEIEVEDKVTVAVDPAKPREGQTYSAMIVDESQVWSDVGLADQEVVDTFAELRDRDLSAYQAKLNETIEDMVTASHGVIPQRFISGTPWEAVSVRWRDPVVPTIKTRPADDYSMRFFAPGPFADITEEQWAAATKAATEGASMTFTLKDVPSETLRLFYGGKIDRDDAKIVRNIKPAQRG